MNKDGFDRFSHYTTCAVKSMNKLKTKGMTILGLTGTHTMCLRHLYEYPDGLTRTKLVRLCDIDKAQVSRIINDLCAKGYVVETESENNNYRKRLKLTSLGKDTTEEINRKILRVSEFVRGDIPEEQMESFYKTLDMICENLKKAETELETELSTIKTKK